MPEKIVFDKYLRRKTDTSSRAIVFALTMAKGTANKNFKKKTYFVVNTQRWTGDFNCPTKLIWSVSPGKEVNDDTRCNGVSKKFDGTRLSSRQVRQLLIREMKISENTEKQSFFGNSSADLAAPKCPADFEKRSRRQLHAKAFLVHKTFRISFYQGPYDLNDIEYHFQQIGG